VAGERVLGVDACRAGWVGVALAGRRLTVHAAASIGELVAVVDADGPVEVVGIDIPIGLPDAGRRQADLLARARIGRLWPSVFLTPVRAALLAADHPTAVAVSRERAGAGISVQAYGLRAKVLQVDRWVRDTDRRVVEIHPEVSFAVLAGAPLTERKHTWAGAVRRRRLLAEVAVTLADDIGPAGHAAGVDDVLDAAVVAWTARRVARGDARPVPDPPETFSDGLQAAIWS
jgi:predicted RNase H-like nuclease